MVGRSAEDHGAGLDRFPGVLRPEVADALGVSGRSQRRWHRRLAEGIVRNELPRTWANGAESSSRASSLVVPRDREQVAGLVGDASGLMIVSGHAGPRFVLLELLASARPDLVHITANPEHWTDEERRLVSDGEASLDDVLRLQFLRLYTGLRAGGVGLVSPDGGRGDGGVDVDMLGTTVTLSRAVAALARRTRCACLPMAAIWRRKRVAIQVADPIAPAPEDDSARWEQAWLEAYVGWLEDLYRADAMHWRLPTALTLEFFEPDPAVTGWHHAYNRIVAATRASATG